MEGSFVKEAGVPERQSIGPHHPESWNALMEWQLAGNTGRPPGFIVVEPPKTQPSEGGKP